MNRRLFRLALFLVISLLVPMAVFSAETAPLLRVTFLDVGQGDSILLRSADKTILIDAGDDRFNAANAAIIPYFRRHGITKIDTLVISHPHRDHFGGILDVLNAVKVGEVIYSQDNAADSEDTTSVRLRTLDTSLGSLPNLSQASVRASDVVRGSAEAVLYGKMKDAILAQGITYTKAKIGMPLNWGKGIKVEVMHVAPERTDTGNPLKANANEDSLIIKVTAGKISYLFTGDAEAGAEGRAAAAFGGKLKSVVLKSGHHGSKTSSNAVLMEHAQPGYAVIQVGKGNSFGHPNDVTLNNYQFLKVKTFRNDLDGTVESWTDGKEVFFTSNQSPLAITKEPKLISLTGNSATLQWETNKTSDSRVSYSAGDDAKTKVADHFVTVHTMTVTGLKPDTTYQFKAISVDEREKQQVVEAVGSFKTPAGSTVPQPTLSNARVDQSKLYVRRPFKVAVTVTNPGTEAQSGLKVNLYHSSMDGANLLSSSDLASLAAGKKKDVGFPIEITWMGKVELIMTLQKGNTLIDTASLLVDLLPKTILVDCAHGNIDYFTGLFAGMKLDLFRAGGYNLKSFSKPLVSANLVDVFAVIVPTIRKPYVDSELAVLKEYVSKGGAVLLFGQSDYKNYSQPELVNDLLKAIGSSIRFNDDQFLDPTTNIGPPWKAFITRFPATSIIKGVDKLLTLSACSLINSQGSGLTAGPNRFLLATGDDDSFNAEADALNDGYIYASHTPNLPVPVAAAEDLGTGRVACIGERWYEDKWYAPSATLKIPLFNLQIIDWLSSGRVKSLRALLAYAQELDSLDDVEAKAVRFDGIRSIFQDAGRRLAETNPDQLRVLKNMCDEYQGPLVDDLKTQVSDLYHFRVIHGAD